MNKINPKISICDKPTIVEKATYLSPQKEELQDQKKSVSEPPHRRSTFSSYGLRNERIAIVVKCGETGRVIHEIPTKYIQELHVWLQEREFRIVDKKV